MTWNIAAECISIVFLSIIWVYSRKGAPLPSLKNKMFQCCMLATFCAMLSNVISTVLLAYPSTAPTILCRMITEIYFLATPLMGLAYYSYTAATIFEDHPGGCRALLIGLLPGLLYALLVLYNPFSGVLFHISPEGVYTQGPLIVTTYLIFYFYCLISVLAALLYRRWLEPQIMKILFIFPLIAAGVIVVQQMVPNVILSGSAATAAILLIYLYLQNKQISLDPLTGLANRQEFQKMMDLMIRKGQSFLVMVISLRDFKQINDHFGQRVGDHFLRQIAAVLKETAIPYPVYRFGGDEFAVLVRRQNQNLMTALADKILDQMHQPFTADGYVYHFSAVIGTALYPNSADSLEGLVNGLEYAVNQAKLQHLDFCYCDEAMLEGMRRRAELIEILKQQLQAQPLHLVYQPIISAVTDKTVAVESLMRIPESTLGPLMPSEFIPIAEETGLIVPITWQILKQVSALSLKLSAQQIELQGIHVNFSAVQLTQPELTKTVLELIRQSGVDPRWITIEITESVLAENPELTIQFAEDMLKNNIRMEMDDFGTGYSNIDSVMHMPLTTVKLDRSLVVSAVDNSRSAIMLQFLVRVFHEMGFEVLAEGVETAQQDEFVRRCGVDLIQGYLISRPLEEEALIRFLTDPDNPHAAVRLTSEV